MSENWSGTTLIDDLSRALKSVSLILITRHQRPGGVHYRHSESIQPGSPWKWLLVSAKKKLNIIKLRTITNVTNTTDLNVYT